MEILYISADLHGIRNIDAVDLRFCFGCCLACCLSCGVFCLLLHVCEIQALLESRHTEAENNGAGSVVHNPSVVNGDVGEHILRKDHACHHHEGRLQSLCLLADFHIFLCVVCVLNMNLQLTALSGQCLRADLFAVQVIGELHANRKLLVRFTLIVDILTGTLPFERCSLSGEFLIALYVLDLGKIRVVLDLLSGCQTAQVIGYRNIVRVAVCLRVDIYGLILACLCSCKNRCCRCRCHSNHGCHSDGQ